MTPSEPPDLPPTDARRASASFPAPEPLLSASPAKPWYRRAWFWILVVVVVALAAWFWHARSATTAATPDAAAGKRGGYSGKGGGSGGGGRRGGPPGSDVMPVGVATVVKADVPIYLGGLGSVTPIATVTVKPRVDGQLARIDFREGQIVKAGEVLAEIDPRPFEVVVTQAEGTLARDQALLVNAKLDSERYKKLVEQDSIATQQLDTQKSLVSQLEGTVKGDRGNLDSAKLQLSYTKVTAPVGGRIGLRQVDVGNMVHASDTTGIVVITQLQPIDVVFSVPEANVQRIMKRLIASNTSHQTLPVDAWDRDNKNKLADGALLTVDNQIDVATGTVKLKGRFANTGYELFPNQFVNARLALDVQKDAIVIPPAALQRGAQGFYVYVVGSDNTVASRVVKPGIAQGNQQVIDDGVAVGEVVVVDGTDKLKDDAKVEPVARDGATVAAPPPGQKAPSLTPEERQKRWEAMNKRIDAGEFGEAIKQMPEEERKQAMRKRRQQQGGDGPGPGGPGGGPPR